MTDPADLGDTNAQHLRSMGLDPDLLGKPYAEDLMPVQPEPGDCGSPSARGAHRCRRPAGHSGLHAEGATRWAYDPPVAPETDAQRRERLIQDLGRKFAGIELYGVTFSDLETLATVAVDTLLEEI